MIAPDCPPAYSSQKGKPEKEQGPSAHLLCGITQTKTLSTYAAKENPILRAGRIGDKLDLP